MGQVNQVTHIGICMLRLM